MHVRKNIFVLSYMVNSCNGQKFFTKEERISYINEYLNMYLWAYFVKKPLNYAKGRSLYDGNQNYIF